MGTDVRKPSKSVVDQARRYASVIASNVEAYATYRVRDVRHTLGVGAAAQTLLDDLLFERFGSERILAFTVEEGMLAYAEIDAYLATEYA